MSRGAHDIALKPSDFAKISLAIRMCVKLNYLFFYCFRNASKYKLVFLPSFGADEKGTHSTIHQQQSLSLKLLSRTT